MEQATQCLCGMRFVLETGLRPSINWNPNLCKPNARINSVRVRQRTEEAEDRLGRRKEELARQRKLSRLSPPGGRWSPSGAPGFAGQFVG